MGNPYYYLTVSNGDVLRKRVVPAKESHPFFNDKGFFCWGSYDEEHTAARILPCGHILGKACVSQMVETATGDLCPVCKTRLFRQPLYSILIRLALVAAYALAALALVVLVVPICLFAVLAMVVASLAAAWLISVIRLLRPCLLRSQGFAFLLPMHLIGMCINIYRKGDELCRKAPTCLQPVHLVLHTIILRTICLQTLLDFRSWTSWILDKLNLGDFWHHHNACEMAEMSVLATLAIISIIELSGYARTTRIRGTSQLMIYATCMTIDDWNGVYLWYSKLIMILGATSTTKPMRS